MTQNKSHSWGAGKPSVISVIAIILLALIAGSVLLVNVKKDSPEVRSKLPAPQMDFRTKIRQYADLANQGNDAAYRKFDVSLRNILAKNDTIFPGIAIAASRKAAEFESVCGLVYLIAFDLVLNERKAEAYLRTEISPFLIPHEQEFTMNVKEVVSKLQSELRVVSVQLSINITDVQYHTAQPPSRPVAPKDIDPAFQELLKSHALDAGKFGIGKGATFMLGNSPIGARLHRLVVPIAQRLFAKQIAAAMALPFVQAVPGIGQIVSAITAVGAAAGIYQELEQFRSDLERTLITQGAENRRAVKVDAMKVADANVQEFRKLQMSIVTKALDQLPNEKTK